MLFVRTMVNQCVESMMSFGLCTSLLHSLFACTVVALPPKPSVCIAAVCILCSSMLFVRATKVSQCAEFIQVIRFVHFIASVIVWMHSFHHRIWMCAFQQCAVHLFWIIRFEEYLSQRKSCRSAVKLSIGQCEQAIHFIPFTSIQLRSFYASIAFVEKRSRIGLKEVRKRRPEIVNRWGAWFISFGPFNYVISFVAQIRAEESFLSLQRRLR